MSNSTSTKIRLIDRFSNSLRRYAGLQYDLGVLGELTKNPDTIAARDSTRAANLREKINVALDSERELLLTLYTQAINAS